MAELFSKVEKRVIKQMVDHALAHGGERINDSSDVQGIHADGDGCTVVMDSETLHLSGIVIGDTWVSIEHVL